MVDLGFNYRLTDFQALLGYRQLQKYKENLIKRKISKVYIKEFKNRKDILFPEYKMIVLFLFFQFSAEEINFKNF